MASPRDNKNAKTAILLAGHGSSHPGGQAALASFAAKVAGLYPEIPVRLAYTAAAWPGNLAHPAPGLSLARVLRSLAGQGFERLVAQSLHVIAGEEFLRLHRTLEHFALEQKLKLHLGGPLLAETRDVPPLCQAITACLGPLARPDQAVVVMGHGTTRQAQDLYLALAQDLAQAYPRAYLGVIEAKGQNHPLHIQNIAARLEAAGVSQALLLPLLTVSGRHASKDLAGNGPKSWINILWAKGVIGQPDMAGLIEREPVARLWLDGLAQMI
jgi:sirohydrochlorin cobaltochelatase